VGRSVIPFLLSINWFPFGLSSWLPFVAFVVPWFVVSVFFGPDLGYSDEAMADQAFHKRTGYAIGFACAIWATVAVQNFSLRGGSSSQFIYYASLFSDVFVFVYPIGFVAWVIWLVHSDESRLADPVRVAFFFAATAAIHLGSFAWLYLAIDDLWPHSFIAHEPLSRLQAAYVSVTTFTTVGSGSLVPLTDVARAAVATESLLSVVMLAVGAVLVVNRLASDTRNRRPR